MMKRKFLFAAVLCLAATGLLFLHSKPTIASYNPSNIMDDAIFDNVNSMSAGQIDTWLNSNFPSSCISTNNGFSSPDPTGYSYSTGFTYGGNVSAGTVIAHAAYAYGINPQVILATLQKESSVVSGDASYRCQYINTAMGYDCPDSGSCPGNPATESGFSKQIIHAAWMLRFHEQRSKGNVGWQETKPGWDNSDDPQTCYSGRMTQGTYQICPSGPSAFYDGWYTIDGTPVHMDSGATAALYDYTPHFSGNQHFVSLFEGWFGSTQFPQPLGASLYHQASTGIIYLINGSTRYQVPDWDMMVNYGLNSFPVQTVSDATIQSLTDGGLLTNLIYDSNGVYLVNNRTRHPVAADMCPVWGLSCSDSAQVKPLGAAFQTGYLQQGGLLPPLMKSGGVLYKLSAGIKQPIANPKTLSDLGFSTTPAITASSVNSKQPLGTLLMTTPGVVQFSPDPHIYYFDGTNYLTVGDMNVYNDWGLSKVSYLSVPISSFNQTPPTSTLLNSWVISNSKEYIVDQGRKLLVPNNLVGLWPNSQFTAPPSALFDGLPSDTLSQLILAGPNIYVLDATGKHYVQTVDEYLGLLSKFGKITTVRPSRVSSLPQGNDALFDGSLLIVQDGSGIIYVVNNNKLTHIPSPNVFDAYGYNWGAVRSYSTSITADYPIDGLTLGNSMAPDGTHYIVSGSTLYQLSSALANDFGAIDAKFMPVTKNAVKRNPATLSRFLLNTDDGRVYYASGGALHYVTSYASFLAYGGGSTPRTSVNTNTVESFIIAQPI